MVKIVSIFKSDFYFLPLLYQVVTFTNLVWQNLWIKFSFLGKKVYVGRFVPRKDREMELGEKARKFTNVYVKNINEEYDEARLNEMFQKFGKISSVKVILPKSCILDQNT